MYFVKAEYMDVKDWGVGYYQKDLLHTNLITRLLMYGVKNPNMNHVPHGSVYGVFRRTPSSPLEIGMAPVGLNSITNRQPVHLIRP